MLPKTNKKVKAMNAIEIQELICQRNLKTISIDDLPRVDMFCEISPYVGTLLCGYDTDRNSFHVYANDGVIHAVTYNSNKEIINHVAGEEIDIAECVPNKRVYPSRTQYFFATRLVELGAEFALSSTEDEVLVEFGKFYHNALIVE